MIILQTCWPVSHSKAIEPEKLEMWVKVIDNAG